MTHEDHVCHQIYAGRGGAQRQLCVLAKALAANGHRVSVAVFYRGHSFERDLEVGDVRVIDLRKRGHSGCRRLLLATAESGSARTA